MDSINKRNYKLDYYYNNHEERKEKMRNYYYSHRNELNEKHKKYYIDNKNIVLDYHKKYNELKKKQQEKKEKNI